MQNHEYEEAIRRELRAHQLAAFRLQRLEAERQAALDMALQRSLGMVHQPTSLYYVEPTVSHPVLEDSWWAAPVRPRSYEPWQPPPLHQLPPESYLMRRNVMTGPPAAPLEMWEPMEDESMQRKRSFSVPSTDRNGIGHQSNSSDQPSFPVSSKSMPSPSMGSQHARSKLKLPSKNKKIAAKVAYAKVVDPKHQPKKRGRPLGSKNAVVAKEPSPPPTPNMRESWNSLGLGTTRGTPAYNAHQRAVHRASGQPLPEELTALDFARKIYSVCVRTVPLPEQSPAQIFLEKTAKGSKPVQQTDPPSMSEKDDKKQRARKSVNGSSNVDHARESMREVELHKKEKKKKKVKNSNGSMAISNPSDAEIVQSDHGRVAKLHSTIEPLEVMTPFPHALHRLYKTMHRQDMEDCSTDMKNSHGFSAEDVRRKIKGFEDEIAELGKLEHQLVKESKQLNATNLAVLEEAHRLLGVMPPEGC